MFPFCHYSLAFTKLYTREEKHPASFQGALGKQTVAVSGTWCIIRVRARESMYVWHVKSEFVLQRWEQTGHWPTSLQGFEQHLEKWGARGLSDRAKTIRAIHRAGKPLLIVKHADAKTFQGEVRFSWPFGGSYEIGIDESYDPSKDPRFQSSPRRGPSDAGSRSKRSGRGDS
jgi:hypothetical protein